MAVSLVLPVLVGAVAGGLVNYLADVLPQTRRLSVPTCVHCGTPYPLGAYVLLRACPNCGQRRGPRPWIVLTCLAILSVYTWLQPHRMGYPLGMLLLTYFAVVVVVDMEHRLILQPTSIVGGLLGLGLGAWLRGAIPTLLGGVAGLAVMSALYYLGVLFSRFRTRRLLSTGRAPDDEEALGMGDVILAGILGMLLGWPLIWPGLLLGILFGGLIGIGLIVVSMMRGRYGKQALMVFMPYGPAFILSAFFILFLPSWLAFAVPR